MAGGPTTAQVTYPYYTTRGPRDFLADFGFRGLRHEGPGRQELGGMGGMGGRGGEPTPRTRGTAWPMPPPAILLSGVIKRYGDQTALAQVSLEIAADQFVA